jgi:hypothetical protein
MELRFVDGVKHAAQAVKKVYRRRFITEGPSFMQKPRAKSAPNQPGKRPDKPAGKRPGKPAGNRAGYRPGKPAGNRTGKPAGNRPGKPAGDRTGKPAGNRPGSRPERDHAKGPRHAMTRTGRPEHERKREDSTEPKAEPQRLPPEIKLPNALVEAWRETLIKISKLPPGTNPRDENRNALAGRILASQSKDIAELWATFTTERGGLSKNLLAKKNTAAAYLGGFHLANAARLQMMLDRAERHTNLKRAIVSGIEKVIWNDFGCGTGALAQTVACKLKSWKRDLKADIHLTDTTATLLDIAEKSARAIAPDAADFKVLKHKKAIEETVIEPLLRQTDTRTLHGYSLGYVWNELKRNPRARKLLTDLFRLHVEKGQHALIAILEPANQIIARDAMELRDALVAAGYVPIYPCPGAGPCPMLKRSRDWCYSEGTWTSPPLMQTVEKQLGIDRTKFSTAAYLFASPELAGQILPTGKRPPVVVGRPQKVSAKGLPVRGFELLICNGDSLSKKPGHEGKSFLLRGQHPIS